MLTQVLLLLVSISKHNALVARVSGASARFTSRQMFSRLRRVMAEPYVFLGVDRLGGQRRDGTGTRRAEQPAKASAWKIRSLNRADTPGHLVPSLALVQTRSSSHLSSCRIVRDQLTVTPPACTSRRRPQPRPPRPPEASNRRGASTRTARRLGRRQANTPGTTRRRL